MPKLACPICFRATNVTYHCTWDGQTLTICQLCSRKVPIHIMEAALGRTIMITEKTVKEATASGMASKFHKGIWDQHNWETHPTIKCIRSKTQPKKDNNHEGMIHNPITGQWSWF